MLGSLNLSGIYNARKAEGSPRDRNRCTANCVVNDLVAGQQFEGIGPVIAVNRKADHPLFWIHLTQGSHLVAELRLQDGRYPVTTQNIDNLQI